MLERPNMYICYIFEKLGVQGCQIWHSHVSIPFNSAPAHSTRPHNAKKSSLRHHFRRNSWKFGSQKLHVHAHFWCTCIFPILYHSQGHIRAKMWHYVTPLTPKKNDQKRTHMSQKWQKTHCGKFRKHLCWTVGSIANHWFFWKTIVSRAQVMTLPKFFPELVLTHHTFIPW